MVIRFLLVGAFIALLPAFSQTVALRAPAMGLLYDAPSRSVRPLVGFPGSSYLGRPAYQEIDKAFIAPDGEAALVIEGGNAVLLQELGSGTPSKASIPELSGQIRVVVWSANSRSVVAYSGATRRVLRFNIGSAGATQTASFDVSHLDGEVISIVTNHDASQTVIGLRHPSKGGIYAISEGGSMPLTAGQEPGPAVFSEPGSILYAVEPRTRRILRFARGVYEGSEPLNFSGEPEPLNDPIGLALSQNSQRLFVASGSDRVIREYDIRSGSLLLEIPLSFTPRSLSPLAPLASVFVVAARDSVEQPLWLLDTRSGRSVSFAPAAE
jgi:WD40 repeat protein